MADSLDTYKEGIRRDADWQRETHWTTYNSGNEAEYALLRMDILNLRLCPCQTFLEQAEVKVV